MLRWRIAILVSAAIAISYLDRQTLPVAIKAIEKDIPLTNEQFSYLQSAFLLAYAFLYAAGGKLTDMLGTRRGFTVVMVAWSVACISHSFALTFAMLAVSRFLLGAGEGGGFPAATRVVAEWFSVKERATAMGIINGGSAVGAVLAPPLISLVLLYANWRWIFVLTGLLGLMWTVWWRRAYFPPDEHPRLTPEEFQKLEPEAELPTVNISWVGLLKFKQTWGVVLAKFMSDAAWYFYLFWLPKYLYDARGFDIKAVGTFAWIPYAAAGIGCLVGGSFSSYMVRRNLSLNAARKIALGFSAALMPSILFVPHVRISIALAIFSLAYFGQQWWSTLVIVLPADLFPKNVVGAVAGMVGFGGAIGGILFGQFAGYLLDHGWGYKTVFSLAGTFHVIGFLILLVLIPVVRPLALQTNLEYQAAI
ncbi:MAG TPA: MFS transporter [Terriglobales bacterium]|nr:MFS transporter [Terriglobales bacterium]